MQVVRSMNIVDKNFIALERRLALEREKEKALLEKCEELISKEHANFVESQAQTNFVECAKKLKEVKEDGETR